MAFIWTDDLTNRAKRMWLAGDSGTAIALAIGAPSKNSVIGRLDRLGVKRPEIINLQNKRLGGKKTGGRKAEVKKPKATPKPKTKFVCGNPWEDDMARKRLADLCAHECRWPIGQVPEGSGHEQLFCGGATAPDDSYCRKHRTIASVRLAVDPLEKDTDYLIRRFAA